MAYTSWKYFLLAEPWLHRFPRKWPFCNGLSGFRDRKVDGASWHVDQELTVTSREKPGVADIMWKIGSKWTNITGAPPSVVESLGSWRRATKIGRSTEKEVLWHDLWGSAGSADESHCNNSCRDVPRDEQVRQLQLHRIRQRIRAAHLQNPSLSLLGSSSSLFLKIKNPHSPLPFRSVHISYFTQTIPPWWTTSSSTNHVLEWIVHFLITSCSLLTNSGSRS